MEVVMMWFLFTGLAGETLLIKATSLDRAAELVLANLPVYSYQGESWVAKRIKHLDQDEGVIFITQSVWS